MIQETAGGDRFWWESSSGSVVRISEDGNWKLRQRLDGSDGQMFLSYPNVSRCEPGNDHREPQLERKICTTKYRWLTEVNFGGQKFCNFWLSLNSICKNIIATCLLDDPKDASFNLFVIFNSLQNANHAKVFIYCFWRYKCTVESRFWAKFGMLFVSGVYAQI